MSEATFRQHLNRLENVLGLLQGDLETGTVSQASAWYDEIVDVILSALDSMEAILNPRIGFDAESLEDEAVVETADLEALDAEGEDAELDETDEEIDDETDEEDDDGEEEQEIEDEEIESS